MEQILHAYYDDNAKKLHRVVDRILLKYGGVPEKDLDDFYSLANEVFADAIKGMKEPGILILFYIPACSIRSSRK